MFPHVAIIYTVQVHQPVITTTTDEFEHSPNQPVRLMEATEILRQHLEYLDPWSKIVIEHILQAKQLSIGHNG